MEGRKLPLCAWCGKSLKWKDSKNTGTRMLSMSETKPGRPLVGWHGKCLAVDPIKIDRPIDEIKIAARGEGRVTYR